jgi:membrane-associated phospholipid phosphatase
MVEPEAGTWKTWVLAPGLTFAIMHQDDEITIHNLQPPAPPDAAATKAELAQLKDMAARRGAAARARIRFWDAGSPAYRWQEVAVAASVRDSLTPLPGARVFALLSIAVHDALVIAWDAKYTYNRPRPSEIDAGLSTVLTPPRSPSYPAEHAVVAGAASAILAYLWPEEAQRFATLADEAAQSRVLAGVQYPSDIQAGLALGRAVAARVIDRAKVDSLRPKWTGTIPTGPGLWTGQTPVGIEEASWKTWALASASEVRPGPPPAPDSPQQAAELAEVKDFKRTPPHPSYPSNAAAFMMAPAQVMASPFPDDAAYFQHLGEEFGQTRLWAGIHFRSDIEAGYAIGRAVAQKVLERAKTDWALAKTP